jgi:hypothetical protein
MEWSDENNCWALEKGFHSKIFNYRAFKVPIIAGVADLSRNFILKHFSNSDVFELNNPGCLS